MRKKDKQKASETHCLSQSEYPMPGTDLHFTTAIPHPGRVPDVDGESTSYRPQFTFKVGAATNGS